MAKKSIYFDKDMEKIPFGVFPWGNIVSHIDEVWDKAKRSQNNYLILCTRGWIKVLVDSEVCLQDSSILLSISSGKSIQLLEASPDYDALAVTCCTQFIQEIRNIDLNLFEKVISLATWQLSEGEYDAVLHILRLGEVYTRRSNYPSLQYINRMIPFILFLELQNIYRIRYADPSQTLGRKQIHYTRFLELARTHLYERQPVGFYLERLNISERYLTLICREIGNNSIRGIIDLMVVREMRMALMTTTRSIAEVAEMFQYPNVSYFIRFFRRMNGVTPAQFRREWLTTPIDEIRSTKIKRPTTPKRVRKG